MSLNNKIEKSDLARDALYDKVNLIAEELDEKKQELLIAGENIKTINGESIVGSGNVEISGLNKNITNCITEIPQDIKLELNNGTITLKAGSKVYVPNGTGVFDAVNISNDVSATRTDFHDCMAWYNTNTGTMQLFPTILFYSGSTAPSGQQFMFWYDITNNKCKVTADSGSTWDEGKSFPLCVVSTDGSQISSIDQVFNGFGYIGSTVFALPGVKGLIPDGRNIDGTLKNIEYVTSKVIVRNDMGINTSYDTTLNIDDYFNYGVYSVGNDNYLSSGRGSKLKEFVCGTFSTDSSGKITSFNPKLPFRAADDQGVVHKSGDETIKGYKRFSDPIFVPEQSSTGTPISNVYVNKSTTVCCLKMGNGIIIQCGSATANNTLTYPIAFTSKYTYFITTTQQGHSDNTLNVTPESLTATSCYVRKNGVNCVYHWIAIGY